MLADILDDEAGFGVGGLGRIADLPGELPQIAPAFFLRVGRVWGAAARR
jgi:hypothetical protein